MHFQKVFHPIMSLRYAYNTKDTIISAISRMFCQGSDLQIHATMNQQKLRLFLLPRPQWVEIIFVGASLNFRFSEKATKI